MNPYFIFDRTQADVDRVKELSAIGWADMTEQERAEWAAGMKGALNRSDLLRIENNCSVIAQLLNLSIVTCNSIPDFPGEEYFTNLLKNVATIRAAGAIKKDTPAVPDMPLNHWRKLNSIEKILFDAYEHSGISKYAGEFYAGEAIELLL